MDRAGYDVERLRFVALAAGLGLFLTPLLVLGALVASGGPSVGPLLPVGFTTSFVGAMVILVPWHRLPAWAFHTLPPIACVLGTWGVAVAEPDATVVVWTFVLIGPFIAFALDRPVEVLPHLLFLSACMLLPVITGAGSPETQGSVLIGLPTIWALTAVVAVLRTGELRQAQLLRDQVRSDPLTGVGNRRLLDERLDYEIVRHHRSGRRLAFITLDLNRFKQVNDELGHLTGDDVLCGAARALTGAVRESDTVARQGGDEFCVLAPEVDEDGIDRLIGSLHDALATVDAGGRPLTAAVGWAFYPQDAVCASALMAAADAHQIDAKRGDDGDPYRTRTGGPVSVPTRTR
ncbi:GGDEF domain-containing protein [Svornostia abyssi]|uniref:GGDEF domain-containing protein n=1 Tax=Svornostia abyssi TaxID=2898438 RepID=A0ABY5PIE2_9ACTN|nr:GGDEF domain-containing protein [Parviterribacteraceae bacterium J379]